MSKALKPYSFFKHDGTGVSPVFDLGEFEDDVGATAWAHKLLQDGPQYAAIEVWDGQNEPFRVQRPEDGP